MCRIIVATIVQRDGTVIDNLRLSPLGLVWKSGEWYLVGRTTDGLVQRHRVSRLRSLQVLEDKCEYPADFSLKNWWAEDLSHFGKGPICVKFTVRGSSIELFERFQLKESSERYSTNEGLKFQLKVDSYAWLLPLLIGHADNVTIHEPLSLRQSMIEWLERSLAHHHNSLDGLPPDASLGSDLRLRGNEKNIVP